MINRRNSRIIAVVVSILLAMGCISFAEVTDDDYEEAKAKAHRYDPSKDTGEPFSKEKETDNVIITDKDKEATNCTIPSEEDVNQILKEGVVDYTEEENESSLPTPKLLRLKVTATTVSVTWSNCGKGTLYNLSLEEIGTDYLQWDDTKKRSYVFKGLNPGGKYKLTIQAVNNHVIWGTATKKITMKRNHSLNTFSSKKKAADSLYKAIKRHDKRYVMYIKSSKKAEWHDLIDMALPESRNGDYWKAMMYYGNFTEEDEKTRVINGVKYDKFDCRFSHFISIEEENQFENQLNKTVKNLKLKGSDANKIKKISRYIDKHVSKPKKYSRRTRTGYAALIEGKASCRGRAVLFYRMAKKAGIKSRIVWGHAHRKAREGDPDTGHYINLVKCGKKYYYIDVFRQKGLIGRYKMKNDFCMMEIPIKEPHKRVKLAWFNKDIGL